MFLTGSKAEVSGVNAKDATGDPGATRQIPGRMHPCMPTFRSWARHFNKRPKTHLASLYPLAPIRAY